MFRNLSITSGNFHSDLREESPKSSTLHALKRSITTLEMTYFPDLLRSYDVSTYAIDYKIINEERPAFSLSVN